VKRRWVVGLMAAASLLSTAQVTKPGSSATAVPSCDARVKAARIEGHKVGYDVGVKEANAARAKDASTPKWSQESYDAGTHANDTDLKSIGGKIPIQILVEEIPNADDYRLAAAEVVTTYFPQHYVISNNSFLMIYISGTDQIQGAVSYSVSLEVYVGSGLKIGERTVQTTGFLNLGDGGGVMVNYSPEERSKAIKAKVYSILSKGDALLFPNPH